MYYKFFIQFWYICLLVLSITGCKSTSTKKPEIVELTKKEYLELIEVSEQWHESKEGIQRLLSVEGDLRMLIGQLDVLVKEETYSEKPVVASTPRREKFTETLTPLDDKPEPQPVLENVKDDNSIIALKSEQKTPAGKPIVSTVTKKDLAQPISPATQPVETNRASALYALQVAAVTEQERVQKSLDAVVKKAPEAERLAVNVEVKNIREQQYYRLKLGAFSDKFAAQAQCDRLKLKQVSCIVSYYTEQGNTGLL
ncbi:hypothetical protein PCIT_a0592 [Pseudoalteromonas citrea]|uniref:SPOR domain-containing protein n=3 Tax=Pseudoalteromonas citrea TaxID=43655 RepID=A0AAD4FT35_9GAMM|nr:hypothetical protein PCIT_a0592 [Pseudoalteromonas citrea]